MTSLDTVAALPMIPRTRWSLSSRPSRLASARKRLVDAGLRNVTLTEADAQTHEFEPDRFDLIASRFGVMFFADPRAAFANLLRAGQWPFLGRPIDLLN
jgi:protein-L-isoaspartate O-methyltransferase